MNGTRTTVIALVWLFVISSSGQAQVVSPEQARSIATNWINLEIYRTGDWGGSDTARVAAVTEFHRYGRFLGYYCTVEPQGFVLVSPLRGMAPTKAYSENSGFDPSSNEGLPDLLKLRLEAILDKVEAEYGKVVGIQLAQIARIVGFDHQANWAMLDVEASAFNPANTSHKSPEDYYEGQFLLSSNWHQKDPYNRWCPLSPPASGCTAERCAVGCAATAAAQITRYWSWPPGRSWLNTPDTLEATDPHEQLDQVGELCRAIGDWMDMQFCLNGCASSPSTDVWSEYLIEEFFEAWSYDIDCAVAFRLDHSAMEWFALIIDELNMNRPIQYGIYNHMMVCDGYYRMPYPHYHINYGWVTDSYDAWYALDALYWPSGGDASDEYMILRISPHGYLGSAISGVYGHDPEYPWRYVDRDCQAASAHFTAGNLIQFLPYIKLECGSGFLRFDGQPGLHTRLFTPQVSRGIRIEKGSIVAHPGGGIQFKLRRP